jgi:hypothetical protein
MFAAVTAESIPCISTDVYPLIPEKSEDALVIPEISTITGSGPKVPPALLPFTICTSANGGAASVVRFLQPSFALVLSITQSPSIP